MAVRKKQPQYDVDSWPVDDLLSISADYNPRTMPEEEMLKLRASLKTFGIVEAAVLNKRSIAKGWEKGAKPVVVGGHQRIKAASYEGIKDFPIVWVDVTPTREKQLNLALNRISGQWDDAKLREVIKFLDQAEEDLALTGFDGKELDNLLGVVVSDEELAAEWTGMPEFSNPKKPAYRSIMVHFSDQKAVEDFQKLLGVSFTENTRFLHFREVEIDKTSTLSYKGNESGDES